MKSKKTTVKGFTIVELMITVAIIGILMVFALPNYQRYVVKSKLEEAKTKLNENYLWLDKMYNKNNGYLMDRNDTTSFIRTSNLPIQRTGSGEAGYDFSIQATCSGGANTSTATAFCLLATPRSGQANAKGGGVECGTLMIDQSGKQSISTNANSTENNGIRCF